MGTSRDPSNQRVGETPGAGTMIRQTQKKWGTMSSPKSGGDEGIRTLDLRLAKPALSQLSYIPMKLQLLLRHAVHPG